MQPEKKNYFSENVNEVTYGVFFANRIFVNIFNKITKKYLKNSIFNNLPKFFRIPLYSKYNCKINVISYNHISMNNFFRRFIIGSD